MLSLVDSGRLPSAVYTSSDMVALGRDEGGRRTEDYAIPADISLVGYDDIMFASLPSIMLTTVAQPRYEIGVQARGIALSGDEGRRVRAAKAQGYRPSPPGPARHDRLVRRSDKGVRMTIDTVLFDMGGTIEDIHFDRALRLKALPGILALLAGEGILLSGTDQEILGKLLSRNAEYRAWSEKAKIESPPETIWAEWNLKDFSVPADKVGRIAEKPRLSVGNQFFHQEDETRGSFHPRGPGGKGIQARRHKQYIEQDPGFQDPRGIRHSEVLRVRDPFQASRGSESPIQRFSRRRSRRRARRPRLPPMSATPSRETCLARRKRGTPWPSRSAHL